MAEIIEISRVALHDQVVARLRTMLVEGRIAPGAKLNERTLSEQLRVSRTPLREAIKLLAAEGLVDLLPNRGAVAVKLTETDVLNTFEVLAELEGLSGELAARRISDEKLSEFRALHYEMLACHERQDLSGYYRLNAQIQNTIIAMITGNTRLVGIRSTQLLISVYLLAGLIYAVAAWVQIGRVGDASTDISSTLNLDSITAVVIGGVSLFGGRGVVLGTLFGALIVQVFQTGLALAGVEELYQQLAEGLLVIAAVTVDQWIRRVRR